MRLALIYVSHTGEKGLIIKQLVNELRRSGQHVLVDLDLLPDDDLQTEVENGIRSAEVMIIALSKEVPDWTLAEIQQANLVARTTGLLIIPVLLDDGQLPPSA